jgi:hypothetical protein
MMIRERMEIKWNRCKNREVDKGSGPLKKKIKNERYNYDQG